MRSEQWYREYETRFWSKVEVKPSNQLCWEFRIKPGAKRRYGTMNFKGKNEDAHRVAYRLVYGDIPEGFFVCHKCDNTTCCNPTHLFLGTPADNSRDMSIKGRAARLIKEKNGMFGKKGDLSPASKVTSAQVSEIRSLYRSGGITQKEIGEIYGLAQVSVSGIVTGKAWKHLPGIETPRKRQGESHGRAKLTRATLEICRQLRQQGSDYKDIATRFGVHWKTVSRALNGQSWRHIKARDNLFLRSGE